MILQLGCCLKSKIGKNSNVSQILFLGYSQAIFSLVENKFLTVSLMPNLSHKFIIRRSIREGKYSFRWWVGVTLWYRQLEFLENMSEKQEQFLSC